MCGEYGPIKVEICPQIEGVQYSLFVIYFLCNSKSPWYLEQYILGSSIYSSSGLRISI
jgi:hypothetical protein